MTTQKKKTPKKKQYSDEILNSRDLAFNYWGTMNYFVGLIKSSELKAGLILSFYGIIFNFIYQNLDKAEDNFSSFGVIHVLAILWILSTIISMYYSVRSFIPRIEKNYDPNMFFFGDIISKYGDIKEYSQTFLDLSVDKTKLYEQLGEQIYINAKITSAKFKNVGKSLKYLAVSLAILLLFIINYIIQIIF